MSPLARIARRLKRVARSSQPFIVHYLGCPDSGTLACTLEFTGAAPRDLTLQVVGIGLPPQPPTETRGRFARFAIDISGVLELAEFTEGAILVLTGTRQHQLPFKTDRLVTDGPVDRPAAWLFVAERPNGAHLVRASSAGEIVVPWLTSTAQGVQLGVDTELSGIVLRSSHGALIESPVVDGVAHIDLSTLPIPGDAGPTYWRAFAADPDGSPLVVNNADLSDPSAAYAIPMLVSRDPHGVAHYAKPYFAKRSGQFSIRTGIKADDA